MVHVVQCRGNRLEVIDNLIHAKASSSAGAILNRMRESATVNKGHDHNVVTTRS